MGRREKTLWLAQLGKNSAVEGDAANSSIGRLGRAGSIRTPVAVSRSLEFDSRSSSGSKHYGSNVARITS